MFGTNRRSGKKLIMVAIMVALVAGAAAAGALLGPRLLNHGAKPSPAAKKSAAGDKEGNKQSDGNQDAATVVSLGDFLVNLNAANGTRYLRAEVAIGLRGLPAAKSGGESGGKDTALPSGQLAAARDRVVSVLSGGDFTQLHSLGARQKIKSQLQAQLQKALPDYQITEVLFPSFVMQ
jgi:flagellar basal body-associated protein FliL